MTPASCLFPGRGSGREGALRVKTALSRTLGLVLLATLTGCATARAPRQHVVVIDRSGFSIVPDAGRSGQRETEAEFEDHLNAITNAIAGCKTCVGRDGTRRILVFVHGGLNTVSGSLERVKTLTPEMGADGYYPLFINWNSGLWSSYWEHLVLVRQGRVQRVWGPLTAPLYLVADLGRAVTRAPVVWYYQLTSDASTAARYETPHMVRRALFLPKSQAEGGARRRAEDRGLSFSPGRDLRTDGDRLTYGVTYVVTLPFKLALGPLIDALGKSAWDNMSRRTQTMFHHPADFSQPPRQAELDVALARTGARPQGAVARLMQRLDDLVSQDSTNHYEITLISHSMGTIVANEIIRTHPDLPYSRIIYMGAACTVSDFEKSVVPWLTNAPGARFYNLTLHPIAEAREAQWSLLDIPPRGSLLEWIDNYLSTPRTVSERTLGKWDNAIATTVLIPPSAAGRVRIKAFDVGSKAKVPEDHPQKHGDFTEVKFWKESFWRLPRP